MAKDKKKGGNDSRKSITKDERFKSVHNDPRFRMPNFKNLKVKVDDRFSKEELSKLSVGALGKKVKIDRYGRKISDKSNDLDKFYEHEDDEEESEEDADDESGDDDDDLEALTAKLQKEEAEQDDEEEDEEEPVLDRARGEGLVSSSEDEDSSSSESDSEAEIDEEEEDSEIEIEEGKPDESDPTSSFAVVNMDWDNIRAVDLMATFISFVPKGGSIKSITIYPSEFGKERMQKEEIEGPPRDLFKSKKKSKGKDDDSSDSEDIDSDIDVNDKDSLAKIARKLYEEDDGNEDYDSKALRRYQLQRLRYYYAIVACDSVQTAKLIYDNCDGTEYESTANIFDLRYVPEDMEFEELEAKDTCNKIPSSYRPDSTFVTDALQHSKVKLTWDETPKERLTLSSRPLSQKEIEENDFKAYLASDSDESAEDGASAKDKYQSLLGQTFAKFGKEDNDDDVDMEITFDPGLKDTQGGDGDEKEKEETTIEAYRRKEKERRQKRLAKFKESKQAENEDGDEESAKSKKSSSKKKKRHAPELDEKSKAELELVLMDNQDSNSKDHFNMKDVIKSERQKKNKKGKKNKKIDEEMVQDNFVANLDDPRFKEIFESHDYAIDPTNSEFKKTETMKKILNERAIRNKGKKSKGDKTTKRKASDTEPKDNVRSLAEKLKKKQRRN
ncbi:Pre-rRNA-processing protein ESF1 [Candida viswanathii]|uniref:Pre-rRNA-processing protein ESF1 n=1 Tax=Candida viswanathii TaxID=5486 RepID=A0A367XTY9_9ASCO|nr:Pre-rRNA-processing protein ESF1 [Candida viswanathii]